MSKRKLITQKLPEKKFTNENEDFFNEFSEIDQKLNPSEPEKSPETVSTETKRSMITRAKTGFSILGFFFLINAMGHFYCALLIYAIQIGIFKEIINLKRNYNREKPIFLTIYILWYVFLIGSAFIFIWYFSDQLFFTNNKHLQLVINYRNTIFFGLYMLGFLAFVISLKTGYIRYQIRLFIETHLVLVLCTATSGAMVVIYHGQIWWLASAIAVIVNDVCAYQVGVVFGRTKLIDLSPKKTVEGFIGGFIGGIALMLIVRLLVYLVNFAFLYEVFVLSGN